MHFRLQIRVDPAADVGKIAKREAFAIDCGSSDHLEYDQFAGSFCIEEPNNRSWRLDCKNNATAEFRSEGDCPLGFICLEGPHTGEDGEEYGMAWCSKGDDSEDENSTDSSGTQADIKYS